MIVPKVPVAAASLGVAKPRKITPRTRKKMNPRGRTFLIRSKIFSKIL